MIDILLSVFNGEKYLDDMLNSLAVQTDTNFRLIIRNNGSTDNTADIIRAFSRKAPFEIKVINDKECLSPVYTSFFSLFDHVTADYVMFADGDDFWLPKKVEFSLAAIQKMENLYGKDMPLLHHTDLILVDEKLVPFNFSMWNTQKLQPSRINITRSIFHSSACGNTFIFNSALFNHLRVQPEEAIMHDIFVTTVAAIFGKIGCSNVSQILYRQHGNNICGGNSFFSVKNFSSKLDTGDLRARIATKYKFASQLLDIFGESLPPNARHEIERIACLGQKNFFSRKLGLILLKGPMSHWARNLALVIFG